MSNIKIWVLNFLTFTLILAQMGKSMLRLITSARRRVRS
jgi:hypothetical protein